MYTISQLAKEFNLSRSTILYYESIELLTADERTESNYRLYSKSSYEKLKNICELREAGLSLEVIKDILSSKATKRSSALSERLSSINKEINTLRKQQQLIVSLLKDDSLIKQTRVVSKDQWIQFSKSAGLDEEGMHKWHMEFEKSSPEGHQDFLESLGLSPEEILEIKSLINEKLKAK